MFTTVLSSATMIVPAATAASGAQTITLARRSADARFTSVDVSADSIADARRRADRAGLTNVEFRRADLFALPFDAASFDHVFVCFVLRPSWALVAS